MRFTDFGKLIRQVLSWLAIAALAAVSFLGAIIWTGEILLAGGLAFVLFLAAGGLVQYLQFLKLKSGSYQNKLPEYILLGFLGVIFSLGTFLAIHYSFLKNEQMSIIQNAGLEKLDHSASMATAAEMHVESRVNNLGIELENAKDAYLQTPRDEKTKRTLWKTLEYVDPDGNLISGEERLPLNLSNRPYDKLGILTKAGEEFQDQFREVKAATLDDFESGITVASLEQEILKARNLYEPIFREFQFQKISTAYTEIDSNFVQWYQFSKRLNPNFEYPPLNSPYLGLDSPMNSIRSIGRLHLAVLLVSLGLGFFLALNAYLSIRREWPEISISNTNRRGKIGQKAENFLNQR